MGLIWTCLVVDYFKRYSGVVGEELFFIEISNTIGMKRANFNKDEEVFLYPFDKTQPLKNIVFEWMHVNHLKQKKKKKGREEKRKRKVPNPCNQEHIYKKVLFWDNNSRAQYKHPTGLNAMTTNCQRLFQLGLGREKEGRCSRCKRGHQKWA